MKPTARQEIGRTALTIAGFDPSSGAGITADLLTFAAHGIFATSAITAMTVQSSMGVRAVHPTDAAVLRDILECLEEDLPPAGIKIGMLASAAVVEVVEQYLQTVRERRNLCVVLDPVFRSSSGTSLLQAGAASLHTLLDLVDAVTPNLNEAATLTGMPCTTPAEMEACASALRRSYPRLNVIVTGGHLDRPTDLLWNVDGACWFDGEHLVTTSTHGTGCAFSSAVLARRMGGATWAEAVASAKQFVRSAMRDAIPRGSGRGPMALVPQLGSALPLVSQSRTPTGS